MLWIILGILIFAGLLYLMGHYTFWLPFRSAKLPRIVMLHQVTPLEPASGMNMPPQKFEQFLKLLVSKKSQFCFVSELDQRIEKKNTVALTFDDGFLDNYEYAFPLLKQYQAKATIYLATQIEGISALQKQHIDEMLASGLIEFGAHTQHHVNLLKLDDDVAREEMRLSKQDVEALTGKCETFAYPFGRFDERHEKMAHQLGFKNAVSTRKKIESYQHNPFNLPRVSTHGAMNAIQMRIALAKGRYKL